MENVRKTFRAWNRKLDLLWDGDSAALREDQGAQKKTAGQRFAMFLRAHRAELFFVALMGCLLFALAWILPFNEAPDEKMRYLVPQYIYRHGTLPAGYDPEIRDRIWGISYGFHPILPYILGGYLMKLVGLFCHTERALLMAARFVNVMFGMGFYWYVLQLSQRLFRRNVFRIYFVALLSLLPQLLYLFVYVNTDGVALFSTAMILNYWLVGLERGWDKKSCTGLAVAVSFCALSYFNAYGYALFSVIVFVGSLFFMLPGKNWKQRLAVILKRGIFITAVVFLLTGWWFIRCAILYDGDFLGLHAPAKYGELYAMEEYKPSVKKSIKEQGISLEKMLRDDDLGGLSWVESTYRSSIGYFGFMKYPLGLDIYEIHKRLITFGALGLMLHLALAGLWALGRLPFGCLRLPGRRAAAGRRGTDVRPGRLWRGSVSLPERPPMTIPGVKLHPANFCLLQFSFVCCIIIPIILSLIYSYTDDFQAQGRYVMPLIIPLMYFVAAGTERFMTLFFRKWFIWILMIPFFYAVLHVFLGAFVSVYLPTFCEELAFLADVRFPWFSNRIWLVKLLYLFIPG